MKHSQKTQKFGAGNIIGIFLIAFAFGMFIGGYVINSQSEEIIIEVEKEQPMILIEFDRWGENINDNSEAIFSYFIFNFGNTEAKNVSISCELSDINENILQEQVFYIGNIASNSYEYQESYMNYYKKPYKELGICRLKNVNGEYINLADRLYDI